MVTVKMRSEMLATPMGARPVANFVDRLPTASKLCCARASIGPEPVPRRLVEPFELARHRGHRFDVDGAFGRALVAAGCCCAPGCYVPSMDKCHCP